MATFVLYQDEDAQFRALAVALEAIGLEVHASGPLGMDGTSDEEQLAFSTNRGWVIYTSNTRDFDVLHRRWLNDGRSHTGIIYHTRQRYSVGEQARRIYRIWKALPAEEMVNQYESLSQWGEDRPPAATSP